MIKKGIAVLMTLLLLAGILPALAEEEVYNALVDKYNEALAAEEMVSEEEALRLFGELVELYEGQSRRNQRFRNAQYYYCYAEGRLAFSREEYTDALEWFGDLVTAGQADADWPNLSFYHDFSHAMFCLQDRDVEAALPLLLKAEQENADAVSLCEEQIDVCADLLEEAIDAACANKEFEQAEHYCDLYESISLARARTLRKQVQASRENSDLVWAPAGTSAMQITLSWSGGTPPYTVSWTEDLRPGVTGHMAQAQDAQLLLTDLLPGTVYQVRVRDSAGSESDPLMVTTQHTQGYRIPGQAILNCQQVNIRQYKPATYRNLRARQGTTLAGLIAYDNATQRISGKLSVDWAALDADDTGYMVIMDTNVFDLKVLEGNPYQLLIHLEGIGTLAAGGGTVGDSECCTRDNMVIFSIQQALVAAQRAFPSAADCAWSVDLLVNNCYIGTVSGDIVKAR